MTGFVGGGLSCLRSCPTLPWCTKWTRILQSAAITSNVILNLFATPYIVIRLLLHRRTLISLYGQQVSTVQHLCIAGILLESAAFNGPVAIILGVSLNNRVVEANLISLVVACQVCLIQKISARWLNSLN